MVRLAGDTHLFEGPLQLLLKHAINWGHELYGHVHEAFREHEADVVCRLERGWTEQCLEGAMNLLVLRGVLKEVIGYSLDKRPGLYKGWRKVRLAVNMRKQITNFVDVKIQNGEDHVWVAFFPIAFDRGANRWL